MEKSLGTRRWIIVGAVIALLVVGFLMPRKSPQPIDSPPTTQSTVPPQLVASDPASPTSQASPAELVAYVAGAVKRPAVYRFVQGARVVDALTKAGGSLPNADLEPLNLAEPIVDGMKIDVPVKGRVNSDGATDGYQTARSGAHRGRSSGHRGRSGGGGRHKLQTGQTLDINTASVEELMQLPGVGPGLARRIVEYRQQNGPFETVDDLQNVSGIGPSKFERLTPFVRL